MNAATVIRESSDSEKRLGWIPFPNPFYTRELCQKEIERLKGKEGVAIELIKEADRNNSSPMQKATLRMNLLGIQHLMDLFQVRLEQSEQQNSSLT